VFTGFVGNTDATVCYELGSENFPSTNLKIVLDIGVLGTLTHPRVHPKLFAPIAKVQHGPWDDSETKDTAAGEVCVDR
jgi:hypothetical protein